jgi:hypothetical protein
MCAACGNNKPWFVANSPDRSDLTKLAEVIRRFGKQAQSNYILRFEIKGASVSHEAGDRV